MSNNIVVVHTLAGREDWFRLFLQYIKDYDNRYPLHVVVTDPKLLSDEFQNLLNSLPYSIHYVPNVRWETGCIKFVHEKLKPDSFIYLHDSLVVKDDTLFDLCFSEKQTVYFFQRFMSYAGKFRKEILDQIEIPICKTKADACINEDRYANPEYSFIKEYMKLDEGIWLFPGFGDSNIYIDIFGKRRMVIENDYLIKFKGCWSWKMVLDIDNEEANNLKTE